MRFVSLPTAALVAALILPGYAANAQVTVPATMQAAPPATERTASVAIDSTGEGAIPALPLDVHISNGISYINGGIGDEEVAELKTKEKEFNVHILLSAPRGAFISDVNVAILDHKGSPLLSVDDAGPYLYAELPPGAYTLQASTHGEQKRININVPRKGAVREHFTFKEAGGIAVPHAPTANID